MAIIFSNKELSTDSIACGGSFSILLTLTAEPNFIDDPENPGTEIPVPGATNIVISDTVSSCFRITGLSSPTRGTATLNNSNNVIWTIDALAATEVESASLEFTVEHIGPCSGIVEVNELISYDDATGNVVTFPSPVIDVDCGINFCEDRCADPVDFTTSGCTDSIVFDAGDVCIEGFGRIVRINTVLRSVCPDKRVALAVILNEVDDEGNELSRGMKVLTVPAVTGEVCRDINVNCVTFVVPDLPDTTLPPCADRTYRARFIANYIDNDFDPCCPDEE
ncbi:MAG: hypothetical protein J6S71_08545 [Clostridia bacterium]|nr:hypothetical protein [Clostridia bacterium]